MYNLQLPCVKPPTSSYNFQLRHGRHSHGGHVGHGGRGEHGGQDSTGQDMTGEDRTKLTFKLNFPGNLHT